MVKDGAVLSFFRTMTYDGKPLPNFNCNLELIIAYKQGTNIDFESNTLRTALAGYAAVGNPAMLRPGNIGMEVFNMERREAGR